MRREVEKDEMEVYPVPRVGMQRNETLERAE